MAQDIKVRQRATPELALTASNLNVNVAVGGLTDLIVIQTLGFVRLFVEISVATNNFDQFIVKGKSNMDAPAVTLYSLATDYTSPTGILVGTSGDLTTQVAGTTGWLILDVRGISEITLQASAAVGVAVAQVYAGGS
jgi:hypothetical protein